MGRWRPSRPSDLQHPQIGHRGAFPRIHNSNGAGCYFHLDATKYLDGVHTIPMTAADSTGNKHGIGSRYFTILNLGGGSPAPEINVRNGGDILDGGDYDFGTKPIGNDTDTVFTITNTGTDILTLTIPPTHGPDLLSDTPVDR